MGRRRSAGRLAAVCLLAAAGVSCIPELAVSVVTRVFEDGSAERRIELIGRDPEGAVPTEPGWLASKAGVSLAAPGAWKRVEQAPDRLLAEGRFPSVELIPGTIAHGLGEPSGDSPEAPRLETRADRDRIGLRREDLVVLTRWVFRERYGDPFDAGDRASAVDTLVNTACEVLSSELHRSFGPGFDTTPAESLLRGEGRTLFLELLSVRERVPGEDRAGDREDLWRAVLRRAGAPVPPDGAAPFWEAEAPLLARWARQRVAASLTVPERRIHADDLAFWPLEPGDEDLIRGIAERAAGSEDALFARISPSIGALQGYYGAGGAARHRFVFRLIPPGRLLRTNGAPDGGGILWVARNSDLQGRDLLMDAETWAPRDDALKSLGARRELSTRRVLMLVDLLAERDPGGELKKLVRSAVRRSSLAHVREAPDLPDDMKARARELADLLDPALRDPEDE